MDGFEQVKQVFTEIFNVQKAKEGSHCPELIRRINLKVIER